MKFFASLVLLSTIWIQVGFAAPEGKPTVLLMDKKENQLKLAHYNYDSGSYEIFKEFHATYGQVLGDKSDESDLKTPEGIYLFTSRLTPPTLKPKFGVMAFYMDYPNKFDQLAGRTGYDIMLHATNDPSRLSKDYDSEGCIVVKNEELKIIDPYIRVGLTPILVFSELKSEYLQPGKNGRLRKFFDSWIQAWEGKDLDRYIDSYHSSFTSKGLNLVQYKQYKGSLNSRYAKISVDPTRIRIYAHPKYTMFRFNQNYQSRTKNGRVAYRSVGTKTLLVAEEDGQLKIIEESYTPSMW